MALFSANKLVVEAISNLSSEHTLGHPFELDFIRAYMDVSPPPIFDGNHYLSTSTIFWNFMHNTGRVSEFSDGAVIQASQVALQYGHLSRILGDSSEAAYWYNIVCQLDPNSIEAWYRLSLSFYDLGDVSSVIDTYIQALTVHKDNRFISFQLANAYSVEQRYTDALTTYESATKQSTNIDHYIGDSVIFFEIGRLYHHVPDLQDLASALAMYDLAVKLDDYGDSLDIKANTHFERGQLYDSRNEWEEALSEYEVALQISPTHYWSRVGKALVLNKIGDYEGALRLLEEAMLLFPDRPGAFIVMGDTYLLMDQPVLAKGAYHSALHLEPNNESILKRLDTVK